MALYDAEIGNGGSADSVIVRTVRATLAQQAPTPAVLPEPAAWIEHHKGGDNLIWDLQKGSPRVTPLYTHPAPSEPAAPIDARDALTDEQILKIAQQPETCPCYPWWLIGNVKVGDLQTAVLSFARAVLARQAAAGDTP